MTTESYLVRRAIYLGMQTEGGPECKTETAQGDQETEMEAGSPGVEKKRIDDERLSLEQMKPGSVSDIP